ncbi:MAG: glycosyltransferase [Kiritimatiellae bacterium]|nr:glycosyltransferase [Kiritimatiellia bacterium]
MVTFIDDLCVGGTQRWLIHMLKGLKPHGYEHKVFVVRNITDPYFLQEARKYAEVEIIGEPAFWCIHGFVHVYREMKRWNPHIVQTLLPSSDMIGRSLGWLARVPVIVSSVRGRNVDKPWWQRWLDRRTAGLADRVIFNTEDTIPFSLAHEGVIREQVIYIPNGVEKSVPGKLPGETRRELGIPEKSRVIGAVGRLHPSKGHKDLIAVFARLAEEMPDIYLLLVGDGELRLELEEQAGICNFGNRILFAGCRPDIADLLSIMDVFVHPSHWEGMPNALMEAMAAGRPIVASGIDGIKALIVDGETGLLVNPGDNEELVSQLRRLLIDRDLASNLGRNAAQSVKERFGLERMIIAYDDVYKTLLRRKTVSTESGR